MSASPFAAQFSSVSRNARCSGAAMTTAISERPGKVTRFHDGFLCLIDRTGRALQLSE